MVHAFEARTGVRHLLSLWPHFRLGLFTSATERTALTRLRKLEELLWGDPLTAVCVSAILSSAVNNGARSRPPQTWPGLMQVMLRAKGLERGVGAAGALFAFVLTRQHCRPDGEWQQRADGNEWDTIKPLALHGLDIRRTILLDDSLRKVRRPQPATAPANRAGPSPHCGLQADRGAL